MTNFLQSVADWHHKFQVATPDVPTFTQATCELRLRLLREELNELRIGIEANDRLEQLDALADMQYVLSGAVLMLGLRDKYEAHALIVNRDNHPDVMSAVTMLHRAIMFRQRLGYLETLFAHHSVAGSVTVLYDCQVILNGLVACGGFSEVFEAAFLKVHRNNWRKTWSRDLVEMNNWPDLSFIPCGEEFIAKDKWGKVVKPPNHAKVDLLEFV